MLSKEASLRLHILRFPLIVGVVFIHNYNLSSTLSGGSVGFTADGPVLDFVRNVISQGVARISVPLLFLIAGYLFFLDFEPTLASLLGKLKSRSKTLLLPFLFWNLATLGVLVLAQSLPAASRFLSGKHLLASQLSAPAFLDLLFGIHGEPIAYQFWFVRDLMVLVLLAPLVYVVCRRAGAAAVLALLSLWLANIWWTPVPACDATLFFTMGAWLAIKGSTPFFLDRIGAISTVLYVPLLLADASRFAGPEYVVVHKVSVLLGVVSALWMTRFAIRSDAMTRHLVRLGDASFFVFAAHEPLLTICRKVSLKWVPLHSSDVALGFYFLIPAFVIVVLASLHPRMRARFPGFTLLACGRR
ncbi:acyltransferase family protein [Trinickia diaoshuihuensis]|uniref:acyltransferase family protein n=1 Tax=Trinickia diaoshuihuensis TaxID=2292265 RepID=UPI000E25D71E|nr:acyltransferase family protein [Trinickia diaoshuihuensis]